jgi:iron complex outermembrane receptor protein
MEPDYLFMNKIITLVVLLLVASVTKGQHTVSGIVSDRADKTLLLQGVEVYIPEFNRTELSREGGTYIFRNVGIGNITLQFSKRGYRTLVKSIHTRDSATVINVEMEPYIGPAEEVCSFSGLTKPCSASPFPVQLYEASVLRRTGYSSFVPALAYEPGIDRFSYGNISRPVIHGLSFNHVALYQSSTPLLHRTFYELEDYSMLEEGTEMVEVIKGPASLLYGDDAMGGVLIYRDEKMPPQGVVNGDFNLGFFTNTVGFNADAGVKGTGNNGIFYSMRLGGKSHTSYIQGEVDTNIQKNTEEKEFAYNSGFVTGNAKGIVGINRKWGQSKLILSYQNQQYEIVRSLNDSAIARIEVNEERNRKSMEPFVESRLITAASENTILTGKSRIAINGSWQTSNLENENKFSAGNLDVRYISNPSEKTGFTAGAQGRSIRSGETSPSSGPHYKVTGAGAYALVRHDREKINLLGGLRVDSRKVENALLNTTKDYTLANGSAGIAFHPAEELTLKVNGSTGFSIPVEQVDVSYTHSYSSLVATRTDLKAEKNSGGNFELSWLNRNVNMTLNAYYTEIRNYIYSRASDPIFNIAYSGTVYTYEQSDAVLKGGDFSFQLHPDKLRWLTLGASYSFVRGQFADTELSLPLMPADKVVANLCFRSEQMNYLYRPYISFVVRNYQKQDRLYYYIHPSDFEEYLETSTPGYTLLDVNLGGSFKLGQQEFDLSLSVTNLINEGYVSHISRLKYLEPVPVREMGRNVSIRLHVPFGVKSIK